MKVAIDISPTQTGHKVRGIGAYTQNLVNEFKKADRGIEFEYFTNPATPPPADVIHYPYFDLFSHTLPIWNKHISRVVTIHDVIPLIFPNHFPAGVRGSINFYLQKRALKNTDFIICDSQASNGDIVDKLSYPASRIKVIYLAPGEKFKKITDSKKLQAVSQKYKLPKEFAIYVGDVNWHKNVSGLIYAVKEAKINLVLVGQALVDSHLAQTQNIDKLIKKLNLQKSVVKTGYVDEDGLVALYNLASLTVLPSFYEGFGLPVLESMACGTPIVCSDKGSLAEIVGDLSFICDPQDPFSIASRVKEVLSLTQKKRDDLNLKLQEHASQFSWDKVAQQTIKVYQQVAKT